VTGEVRERLRAEAECFGAREDIHGDLPPAYREWSRRWVEPAVSEVMGGAGDDVGTYVNAILELAGTIGSRDGLEMVSLGCGEARVEVRVCRALVDAGLREFRLQCIDLAPQPLERARALAVQAGVEGHMEFAVANLGEWAPARRFDVVTATQFLHHVVELERLFDAVHAALTPAGIFVTVDMIGRNGHMLWPEALGIVDAYWAHAPERLKFNHCLGRHEARYSNWDNSREGFEGIRAQDILPNLVSRFHFERFVAAGNIAPALFGRHFGPNFDMDDPGDRALVAQFSQLDHDLIDVGYLKPVLLYAVMSKTTNGRTRCYRHWTPEFCVRDPAVVSGPATPGRLEPEATVQFCERSPALEWLRAGWSSPEPGGTWSNARQSVIEIPVARGSGAGWSLLVRGLGDVFPPKSEQVVRVTVNGRPAGEVRWSSAGTVQDFRIPLTEPLDAPRTLNVRFVYSDIRSRRDLGEREGDVRHIAFFLHSVQLARS
jgi:2-polyprenyl-3-methyl-5-hydroxy-6-metoxy-1,4-benzoquinol methylase